MDIEDINRIEILESGELFVGLSSEGKSSYQYIYRAGSGVYWDNDNKGFKSTPIKEWSTPKWFAQIRSAVESELDVTLKLGNSVSWSGIEIEEKSEIENE